MDLAVNKNEPLLMHVDLNSCFATIEQQANLHLRGKPLVIAAYVSPGGCIISPSIEAKKIGIRVGMSVREAKLIYPQVIVRDPDPYLVRDVHIRFKKIFQRYTPSVVPKSIDEAILDFKGIVSGNKLAAIAWAIKQRMRKDIGEWISCNIGIATNRFLAKLAASLHKPDGLDFITYKNLKAVYQSVELTDLNGINKRFEARLNLNAIFTPLQFFFASEQTLRKNVFQSIVGWYWYLRLRGWEIDEVEFKQKSFGQDFALGKKTSDKKELAKILMKLAEKMGRRLRRAGCTAQGLHLGLVYSDWTYWHKAKKFSRDLYATTDLFKKALYILNCQPANKVVAKISLSCYGLKKTSGQLELFDFGEGKKRQLASALDKINDYYGEYVVTPALMMNTEKLVLDRVAYGSVKELEDLYAN